MFNRPKCLILLKFYRNQEVNQAVFHTAALYYQDTPQVHWRYQIWGSGAHAPSPYSYTNLAISVYIISPVHGQHCGRLRDSEHHAVHRTFHSVRFSTLLQAIYVEMSAISVGFPVLDQNPGDADWPSYTKSDNAFLQKWYYRHNDGAYPLIVSLTAVQHVLVYNSTLSASKGYLQ